MGLFDWLFRKPEGGSDRPAAFIAYFDPSTSEAVQLNRNMEMRELYLVNSANGISCASVVLASVFITARAQGWEGGAELFRVTRKASYLLPFRTGLTVSDADALSLSNCLRTSL